MKKFSYFAFLLLLFGAFSCSKTASVQEEGDTVLPDISELAIKTITEYQIESVCGIITEDDYDFVDENMSRAIAKSAIYQKTPLTKGSTTENDRFPDFGLHGILSYIREKGMVPGIWLEAECCEAYCQAAELSETALCRRNGLPIGGSRNLFDLRDPAVRRHLHALIDRLCDMSVGFFKNDYNRPTGIGFSDHGGAFSEEAAEAQEAVLDFFDEVHRRHPGIIIENCGSGAMRADNGFLSHFEMQSSSDQELYYRYPSILSGSLACMTPEKCGVWAYPYPFYLPFDGSSIDQFNDEALWAKKREQFADGEDTVFNMVSGLMGCLYLSGRIDRCDEKNAALVKEGIALFKRNRASLTRSVPVWPAGTFSIEEEGMFCTGLLDKEAGKLRLAVWNINAHKKTAVFNLSKWAGRYSSAAIVYPSADTSAQR